MNKKLDIDALQYHFNYVYSDLFKLSFKFKLRSKNSLHVQKKFPKPKET